MITIALLCGGNSAEREISFKTAAKIQKHLNISKYELIKIEISTHNIHDWALKLINSNVDIVINALHGGLGENGAIQGFLDALSIPYIGSRVLSSAICMDKKIAKQLLLLNNIPVADDIFINRNDDILKFEKQLEVLGYPLIVKPNNGGSSLGIGKVLNFNDLIAAAYKVLKYNDDILIEKYLDGNEVTCSVIETQEGLHVLTVLDITKDNEIFDYNAKYNDNSADIDLSALPLFLKNMIESIAKKSFTVLKCKGYAAVDMIVYEEQIFVLEINTLPGITSHSLIPKALDRLGINLGDYLDNLIMFELKK